jgi:tryptophanyl-tRNA synthetase
VFELAKLEGAVGDEPILDWLRFLNSDEVESMEAIAEKNEGVSRAVTKFKELTASEYERMTAAGRAKDKRLRAGQLAYARDEGHTDVAKRMKEGNEPVEKIASYTGLSVEEIEKL